MQARALRKASQDQIQVVTYPPFTENYPVWIHIDCSTPVVYKWGIGENSTCTSSCLLSQQDEYYWLRGYLDTPNFNPELARP